jgi:hypothetical protein
MGLRIVISLQTILQQGVLVGRQQLCSLALCCAGLLSLLTSKGTKIACQIVYLQLPSRLRFDVRPEVKLGWTSDLIAVFLPLQSSAYVLVVPSISREDASRCHRGLDYLVLAGIWLLKAPIQNQVFHAWIRA